MRARDVVFVDGVRTPFGKSGPKGIYAETRADDLVIRVMRELLRRNPDLPHDRIGEVAIAGGGEHMGRHPMGEAVDPNPRFIAEQLVDESALFMGMTAENLHDRYPAVTKDRADAYALASQQKVARAYEAGKIQPDLVPMAIRTKELGWGWAAKDEPPRPETTLDGLAALKTPFRPHGRVTAGNSSGINDGATGCVIAAEDVAAELGLTAKMRLV